MQVKVKLFGTLGQQISGYGRSQEIEVEIPEGARVGDLLTHLGISESRGVAVIAEGRVLAADDVVKEGSQVNVMQAVSGG